MVREHTHREYELELQRLREQVAKMSTTVVGMLQDSLRALVERDDAAARRTIDADEVVNALEVSTDELCLTVLARRQPLASDLRFITIALKIVTDLERIGDLCVNIGERAIELNGEGTREPLEDLQKMGAQVESMLREAMEAFMNADTARAEQVISQDRMVDAYYAEIFRDSLTVMMQDSTAVYRATRVQAIAKYLERIGDHATNLAEMVVFMVKGKDIRHRGRRTLAASRVPHGILFLCVHNSARSQIAEGWAKQLLPTGIRVWSAGSQPVSEIRKEAVEVMREVGIDISRQRPKRISDVPLGDIDMVVTLCAEEVCMVLPGDIRRESWVFPDPTSDAGSELLPRFREVREGIRGKLQDFVKGMRDEGDRS